MAHAKVLRIDDRVLIGGCNLDDLSLFRNHELDVLFEHPSMPAIVDRSVFDELVAMSAPADGLGGAAHQDLGSGDGAWVEIPVADCRATNDGVHTHARVGRATDATGATQRGTEGDAEMGTDPASAPPPPSRRAAMLRSGLILGILFVVFVHHPAAIRRLQGGRRRPRGADAAADRC